MPTAGEESGTTLTGQGRGTAEHTDEPGADRVHRREPGDRTVAGATGIPEAAMDFKTRWEAIQQGFVDDPAAP